MIAVKNTTEFLKSPRFTGEGDDDDGNSETGDASTAQAATATADANAASDLETVSDDKDHGRHPNIGNGTSVNAKRDFLGNSSYVGQKGAALLDKKNDFMKRDLSGKTLKNLESPSKSPVALYDSPPKEVSSDVESDNLSFHHQQQRSNIRKRENDYTVREADKIYRKYFVDASIDPEIKALWDSRNKWSDTLVDVDQDDERQNNSHNTSKPYKQQAPVSPISETLSSTTLFTKLKNTFNSLSNTTVSGKPVETKGFQVSRPRPLIVKPLSQLQVPKNEEDSFEDSDYSFNLVLLNIFNCNETSTLILFT
ncbi:hypothetical protein QCA50_019205 [Cerrena zonata]|uniref:Uncharacterized protein n=1 Tax=Cerrena zonata TaxID=2478898 RepID=A0AAW0FB05_9APHY